MAGRAQNLKDQVGQLWRGAVAQASGVRDQLRSQGQGAATRVRGEINRLRGEREQLVSRLGEQTLSWVNANRKAVPGPLKPTVEKLNRVIERLVKHEAPVKHEVARHEPKHEAAPVKAVKRTSKKKSPTVAVKPMAAKKKATAKKVSKQPVGRKANRDEQPA